MEVVLRRFKTIQWAYNPMAEPVAEQKNDSKKHMYLGLKKILFVSDFRTTLSKHVRPKIILWISKKKNFFFFLP